MIMTRHEIITIIGSEYLEQNIESGEFSYPKALKKQGKSIEKSLVSTGSTIHKNLDLRFVKGNISILIETKANFDKWRTDSTLSQIQAYVNYEKALTGNKIIAILANTEDDRIKVWWGSDLIIDDSHQLKNQYKLKGFDEYADLYSNIKNNKEQVIKNTYELNELLHKHGVGEKIRSQFVGTCLLALKYHAKYEGLSTKQIIGGIEDVISGLLDKDIKKAEKLAILKTKVLESQDVYELKPEEFQEILRYIDNNILPYINDKSTMGQDILNLFFTTFNKYVGKADKNQAFTPDHIVHFMCQVVGINRNSRVLDPCAGSGAFLVRAMTEAMDDCANEEERNKVKKEQIFGIEYEETAFGLSTTNMLIHGDGNSNVRMGSCFSLGQWIEDSGINVVLMNPPYNAQKKHCNPDYVKNWNDKTKEDPSSGFHYVHYIASKVKTGKLAVLLPMQCAIGSSKSIQEYKVKMLQEHTLDAVLSLPADMFHPGANVNACCMIFNLGQRHEKSTQDTFFGYFKDDGFIKKKKLGRIEKTKSNSDEGIWADIESYWLDLYRTRKAEPGVSVIKRVTAEDEWLAEAFMETDFSLFTDSKFEETIRKHLAYFVFNGIRDLSNKYEKKDGNPIRLIDRDWKQFKLCELFKAKRGSRLKQEDRIEGSFPLVTAGESNLGVKDFISNDQEIFENKITIDMFCNSYAHMDAFCCDDNVITLGTHETISFYAMLFVSTVITLDKYRYQYGRQYRIKNFETHEIKLPSDDKGNPDWKFMEDYIKSLAYAEKL